MRVSLDIRGRRAKLPSETIETELGLPLVWDPQPDRRICSIRYQPPDSCGWGDDSEWDEQHTVMAENLKRMYDVFAPLVRTLEAPQPAKP